MQMQKRYRVDVLDYIVTSNHVHLLLTAKKTEIQFQKVSDICMGELVNSITNKSKVPDHFALQQTE
jgi:hypothetical protein